MKKFIYSALVALLAISCDQTETPWGGSWTDIPAPQTLSAYTPEFDSQASGSRSRALTEYLPESWDESDMPHTRTYAVVDPNNASEYYQYWSEGDAISVFFTTTNQKYQLYSTKGEEKDYGFFNLVGDGNNTSGEPLYTGYIYSIYPYKEDTEIYDDGIVTYTFPETQHYSVDSYANGENGMIAIEPEETDNVLYFQNFCSYLQLRMATTEDNPKSVKQITLIANNKSDKIAGRGEIEFDGEAPVVYMLNSATNQITLDCGSGVALSHDNDDPTKFWFVLPGGFTFTKGFSVSVVFSDNSIYKKSTTKEIDIARNHIKPMATLTPDIVMEPIGPIRYKYNDSNTNEPYPLKNTFFDKEGNPLDIVDQTYDEETGEWLVLLSGTLSTIGGNSFTDTYFDLEYIKIDNGEDPVTISDFAFYNCTADYIEVHNDVTSINNSAFVGSTIADLNIYGDVTTIKSSAGMGSNIENLNITGSIELIDEQAFSSCDSLTTVNIGHVESIASQAFYNCGNLTQANISGAKYIGPAAFHTCSLLEAINLDAVVTIEDGAFFNCSSLTEVVISANCTLIGEGAFCNAISLQTVYCYAVDPPFIKTDNDDKSYVFDNAHANLVIYIPEGSKSKYTDRRYFANHTYDDPNIKATTNWWQQEYRGKLKEMTN